MSKFRVLLTDYAWPDLDIETRYLNEHGVELIVAENGDESTLAGLAKEHQVDAIMTNWAQTTESVIAASPNVKIVSRLGIGLDNIAVDYCTSKGIVVTNVPDYCLIEVAEHALALILTVARKTAWYHWQTKQGEYNLQSGSTLRRMEGQTLGILGWGNIGHCLAQKALGLGMKVIAFSRSGKQPLDGVQFLERDEVLSQSDYLSLHLPLTPETNHYMNDETLGMMKPTAFLINTARGGVVDQEALARALAANKLAGAALDVQTPEPPDLSQPPFNDPRVVVTPHAAFVSIESLENLRSRTVKQVLDQLEGRTPECVVNPSVLG